VRLLKTSSAMSSLKRARSSADNPWHNVVDMAAEGVPQMLRDKAVAAGKQLRKLLLTEVTDGTLPADRCALLCHYISVSHGIGVEDLAVLPDQLKHASHHINTVVAKEFRSPDLDYVATPMFLKSHNRRKAVDQPVQYAYAAVAKDFDNHVEPLAVDTYQHPSFADHVVVKRARAANCHWSRVIPLQLFWDGVAYSSRDEFWSVYFTNLRSGKKWLSWIIRADDMCKCGCKGWCTVYPLLLSLCYDLNAGAQGRSPTLPFCASSSKFMPRGCDNELGVFLAVMDITGDTTSRIPSFLIGSEKKS
jgi:hypothetical protein